VAIGIHWEGRRCVLAVELAQRESAASWKELPEGLKGRGVQGGRLVVSDDPAGLKRAVREVPGEALRQRCYAHLLRNAPDYLPRRGGDDCLTGLRWIWARRTAAEARQDLKAWIGRWQGRYSRLCQWVEENLEDTLSFCALPLARHKHLKSANMLERLNEGIKGRTPVVRIFPEAASCLRLVRALAVEIHEDWIEATR